MIKLNELLRVENLKKYFENPNNPSSKWDVLGLLGVEFESNINYYKTNDLFGYYQDKNPENNPKY